MKTYSIPSDLKPAFRVFGFYFDELSAYWHNFKVQKCLSNILIFVFLCTLVFIQIKFMGLLPAGLHEYVPDNHLNAVDLAFKLLLIKEVIDMIFFLPNSISSSQKKQLEVFSLILIRFAFKEIPPLDSHMDWYETIGSITETLASGFTGLIIFIIVTLYGKLRNTPALRDYDQCGYFVAEKKTVAFVLLVILSCIVVYDLTLSVSIHKLYYSIELFFTVFIFADITIVLISLRYSQLYYAVFRNSGFAFVAVLIRISITAPPFYREAIALFAAGFAYFLALAYNKVTKKGVNFGSKVYETAIPESVIHTVSPAKKENLSRNKKTIKKAKSKSLIKKK